MLGRAPTMLGIAPTMLGTVPTMLGTVPTMLGAAPTMPGTTVSGATRHVSDASNVWELGAVEPPVLVPHSLSPSHTPRRTKSGAHLST